MSLNFHLLIYVFIYVSLPQRLMHSFLNHQIFMTDRLLIPEFLARFLGFTTQIRFTLIHKNFNNNNNHQQHQPTITEKEEHQLQQRRQTASSKKQSSCVTFYAHCCKMSFCLPSNRSSFFQWFAIYPKKQKLCIQQLQLQYVEFFITYVLGRPLVFCPH